MTQPSQTPAILFQPQKFHSRTQTNPKETKQQEDQRKDNINSNLKSTFRMTQSSQTPTILFQPQKFHSRTQTKPKETKQQEARR